jgi:hypothetical protein
MFTWGKHLIRVVHNFATPDELSILDDYLKSLPDFNTKSVSWLDFIEAEHKPEYKIDNPNVEKVMRELNTRTNKYITEVYFPESELSVIRDNGNRELELVRWSAMAHLAPHSDWRLADGSPVPLALPQFTLGSLVYINKDYAGGEINFPDYDFKLDPQPGDLILFPCQYMHEVLQVLPLEGKEKANRYTMPVFYWFDLEEKE